MAICPGERGSKTFVHIWQHMQYHMPWVSNFLAWPGHTEWRGIALGCMYVGGTKSNASYLFPWKLQQPTCRAHKNLHQQRWPTITWVITALSLPHFWFYLTQCQLHTDVWLLVSDGYAMGARLGCGQQAAGWTCLPYTFQVQRYKKVLLPAQDARTSCRCFSGSLHLENMRISCQTVRSSQIWRHVPPAMIFTLSFSPASPQHHILSMTFPSILHSLSTHANIHSLVTAMPQVLAIRDYLAALQGCVQNQISYFTFSKHSEGGKSHSISGQYHDYLLFWLPSLYCSTENLVTKKNCAWPVESSSTWHTCSLCCQTKETHS